MEKLKFDFSVSKQPIEEKNIDHLRQKTKQGRLQNHTVTLVVLGTGALLSVTAAVVAAVFAAYLLAAACATAFTFFSISIFLSSRIKPIQQQNPTPTPLIEYIPQSPAAQAYTNMQALIADMNPLPFPPELKPQQELHFPAKNPKENIFSEKDKEIELLKKRIDEFESIEGKKQKNEIEKLKEENGILTGKINDLNQQIIEKNQKILDLQQGELAKVENLQSLLEEEKIRRKSLEIAVEKAKNSPVNRKQQKKLEDILNEIFKGKKTGKKGNQVNEIRAILINDLTANNIASREEITKYYESLIKITDLEQNEVILSEDLKIEFDEKDAKQIRNILNETLQTEITFSTDIHELKTFFELLLKEKLISDEKFHEILLDWEATILESKMLIKKLNDARNAKTTLESLKFYNKALSPKNLKRYLETFIQTAPKTRFLDSVILKLNETEEGKKLCDDFCRTHNFLTVLNYTPKFVQRITRHPLLQAEMLKVISTHPELKNAIEYNYFYIKSYADRVNVLNPKNDAKLHKS